jgi:ribulose-phosphate 3-epimerase
MIVRSVLRIEVDGSFSFENVPHMIAAGADTVVAGSSSLFKKGLSLQDATQKLRHVMRKEI